MTEHVRKVQGAGLTLHVRVSGPADGPGVLLLHGGGQTGASWGNTAAALAASGHHVWVPDLRGHGESDRAPDGDYAIEQFVADARALVAEMGSAPIIVGASLGGITALLLAGSHGATANPVRALVLVDIALRAAGAGVERIVRFMRSTQDGFTTLEEARDAIARYLPHRRAGSAAGLQRVLRRTDDGRWVWHWDPRLLDRLEIDEVLDGGRLREAARRIAIPLLLVRGGASDVVSEDFARELVDTVAGARWLDVREVGHMVAGDDNDAFTTAVLGFVSEVP